ncbi:MAG: ABC transporter transmembrane domain-containing protein, partial [Vicinamibacteria bacterium]|nr:ABC transporter transmembrane domain-containing protein [Vicinamibacteria bacterium]
MADLAVRLPAGDRRARLSAGAAAGSFREALTALLRLAARERAAYAFGTTWILVSTAATLLYPQFVRVAIDEALAPGRVDHAALLMAAAAALRAVGTYFRGHAFESAALRIVGALRLRLFGRLLEQDITFFDRRSSAELGGRLGADAELVHDALGRDLEGAVRDAVCVIGGVAVLLWTSPALTALVVVAGAPLALAFRLAARRIRRYSRSAQDAFGASQQVADEALSGIRTVRAFSAEAAEAGRYRDALERALVLGRQRVAAGAALDAAAKLLGDVALITVIWAGARLVGQGDLSPGLLVAFILYAELVASCFGDLVSFGAECARVAGAAERLFEVIDAPRVVAPGRTTIPRVDGRVRFEAVAFAYPTRPAAAVLRGVDLELAPGELVALVGPSGAGKSTLARLLLRFYEPTAGTIRLDGVAIGELEPVWFRRQVGVVEQEPFLFSTSVGENLRCGAPDATDERVVAALDAACAS